MTAEELKKALEESPELIQSLGLMPSDSVEELVKQKVDEETAGLKKKRDELLGKLKKVQDSKPEENSNSGITSLLEKYGVKDEDELHDAIFKYRNPEADEKAVELEKAKLKLERDFDRLNKSLKDRDSILEKKDMEIQSANSFISEIMINKEFKDSLITEGYDPRTVGLVIPGLIAKSKAQVVVDDNGTRTVETDDGTKSIKEWVLWWKDTDEGKVLRGAPENSGGGALGSTGGGVANYDHWKTLNASEKMKFKRENPARAQDFLKRDRGEIV